MPKINQEEYEVLKTMLSVGYEYIAREKEGHVIVFTAYHGKSEHRWMVTTNRVGLKCESLFNSNEVFQFIQWTDDEPYEIAELIREYEYTADYYASQLAKLSKVIYGNESEEKEVKDLEWAKKEIESLMTEESQSYPHDKMVEQEIVLGILNQLDELEVLTQEWIDKNKFEVNGWNEAVHVEDLQNLLVPKQEDMFNGEKPDEGEVYFAIGLEGAIEISSASNIDEAIERLAEHETNYSILKKPVIPKFIAEVIVEHKELGYDVYDSIDLIIETNGGGLPSLSDWVAINIDKYARAWLNGYMVEKEHRYYVSARAEEHSGFWFLSKNNNGDISVGTNNDYFEADWDTLKLTEQEIKDYDERYWVFRKPVEEVEE